MKPNEKTRNTITALLKELETILAPLMPTELRPGIVMEPDFRRLVIPSPSPVLVEAAIDAVTDYTIRQEFAERARRLEADLTNFDCNKRRFFEECDDMEVAEKRQADGTLSDTPEALKQLRRNLKGDIARLKEIIDGTAREQTPVPAQLAAFHVFKSPNTQGRENAARLINEIYHSDELKAYAKSIGKKKPSRKLAIDYIRNDGISTTSEFYNRAKIIRESVLTALAKSSSKVDVQAAWNSILTIAKRIDPQKGTRQHTDAFLEGQAERRHDNDNKPGVVPNIGDKSSRYKGW